MASVSAHPYIVQVFHADITPDGRPYLVMEYYSGPNFYERARSEKMSIAEALRVGVQLARAPSRAAHRAGILHRDIKPANVLTTEYDVQGSPTSGSQRSEGPETDDGRRRVDPVVTTGSARRDSADRRSDVYSLAATIVPPRLTGRSPFEIPGGDNGHLALIGADRAESGTADRPCRCARLARACARPSDVEGSGVSPGDRGRVRAAIAVRRVGNAPRRHRTRTGRRAAQRQVASRRR